MKISYEACRKGLSLIEHFLIAMINAYYEINDSERAKRKVFNGTTSEEEKSKNHLDS